jgi:hypothetical protein
VATSKVELQATRSRPACATCSEGETKEEEAHGKKMHPLSKEEINWIPAPHPNHHRVSVEDAAAAPEGYASP